MQAPSEESPEKSGEERKTDKARREVDCVLNGLERDGESGRQ